MHILMVSNNYTPFTGGVVSSINAQVEALQQLDHTVTLVTLHFTDMQDPKWVKRLYCPVRFIYKKNHMAIAWRPKKQIADILTNEQPDVVHVHHPFMLGAIAHKVAQKRNIPVIFTHHTVYEAYVHYVPLPQCLIKKSIVRYVLRFCKRVDGIIAPSAQIADRLHQAKVKNITVLPSGLLDVFLPKHLTLRPIESERLKLLVVSRMVKEKNIEAILRVARHLVDVGVRFHLTLIGYGAAYDALKAYAFEHLVLPPDCIQFIHKPSKHSIAKAYQEADLFLFSSKTDTQGLVLAEAMIAGAPVIAFDGPGQRDIIKQGENGFIVQDEQHMINTIKYLAQNKAKLTYLSRQAHKIGQSYHPVTLAKKLVQCYAMVLS